MKIAASAYTNTTVTKPKVAILPLVPVENSEARSDQMVTHSLRSNPADADSPKYKEFFGQVFNVGYLQMYKNNSFLRKIHLKSTLLAMTSSPEEIRVFR